jgi:uncharacterized protein (TIGR03435 family)
MIPLEGGPTWLYHTKFSIIAKTAKPESVAMMRGPIMRKLLEDRFRLRVHNETREYPVYLMTVDKNGLKMKPTKEGNCNHLDPTNLPQSIEDKPGGRPWCTVTDPTHEGTHWTWDVSGMSMDLFARIIKIDGLWVIDRTGLAGTFDIHLEWNYVPPNAIESDVGVASEPLGTSLASAIHQKLGLQLTKAKGPRQFLVIDHLERPSEN